jgi:hypothetical protein
MGWTQQYCHRGRSESAFIGACGDFPEPDGGRSRLQETLGAKITSIATILSSPDIGQTRVAEVGLESGFYRYMFCEGQRNFRLEDTQRGQSVPSDCPR